ncbi:MAG: carbohydrate ABC transporter permease [SAR324 cluster bacterium]|nr:carbohydrate ABC transporter permease [SAR324 cluster bacterium]
MPIISQGGRKSLKVRLIFITIYTILIVGTITMAYPFLLMLSSSVASPFDFDDLRILPKYLTNNDALVKKQLYAKYGRENFRQLGVIYRREADWSTWGSLRSEKDFIKKNYPNISKRYAQNQQSCVKEINDWNEFKKTLSPENITSFFPDDYDAYRDFLKSKYSDKSDLSNSSDKAAIAKLNQRWQRAFNNFAEILPLKSFLLQQKWFAPKRADFDDLIAYHSQLPASDIKIIQTRMLWSLYLEKRFVNTSKFTKQTGIKTKQFSDLSIPTKNNPKLYPIWQDFLNKKYPLRLVKINGKNAPADPIKRMQWLDVVLKKVPPSKWQLNRPVNLYRTFLKDKYDDNIAAVNSAYASDYKNFKQITLPLKLADYVEFTENKTTLRWSFFTVNYKKVIDYLTTKGRAIWVTVLLVSLTIAGALTVNPLAAYALSRGKQSTSAKILIFFLATMAFPAEVAMIPGFLLLRDLSLLNTFGALVLPGLANGYSIFLLKGFFDSVPRELYEAADIDGAGEFTKFWRITFPMSKPILAVIALGAFTMSYGGFMWAFLTCQDPKMWTIMVWLYDFQGRYASEPGMCMAAFTLASIPTLLVFLFCQKIIMRGIVIPTMK